jgi:hypothetical protein
MHAEGPLLEVLTRRLAETPADFLAEPLVKNKGGVDVAAVVADLLRDLGGELPADAVARLRPHKKTPGPERDWLRAVLVTSWLLHDPWFRARGADASRILTFFNDQLRGLSQLVPPASLTTDANRREELARLTLSALGLRPAGETAAQAADRLQTLDSVERQRVLKESLAAEERARQVREAMARQAAEEAAASYGEQ